MYPIRDKVWSSVDKVRVSYSLSTQTEEKTEVWSQSAPWKQIEVQTLDFKNKICHSGRSGNKICFLEMSAFINNAESLTFGSGNVRKVFLYCG